MQKQHIWIHESKCGELYTDICLNSWFFIRQNRRTLYQPWDWKSLTPCRSLWSWCSLLRGTEKIQLYLGQWKGREREGCWYTRTICGENQPWQHYSFSVEWRYPGSCVTLLLHHCSHIPPKPHYCWSMLPLSHLGEKWSAWKWYFLSRF